MSTLPQAEPARPDTDAPACRAATGIAIVEKRCDWQDCGRVFAPGRPNQRFCGKDCKDAWYKTCRPRVLNASAGAPRERDLLTEWLALMSDGEPRDCMQMAVDLQCLPQSASATLRRARAKGFRVVSDLPNGCVTRAHRYRLVLNG